MEAVIETGCCPRFDAARWDGKELKLDDRLFVKDRVRSFLHVPLNFGTVMKRAMTAIEAADATDPDNLVLTDEKSPWGADVYVAVTKDVPGARTVRLSATVLAKVFEGHYGKVRKWCGEMTSTLAERGLKPTKMYYWYTTCPRCAKAYGKNYVVLLAQVQ